MTLWNSLARKKCSSIEEVALSREGFSSIFKFGTSTYYWGSGRRRLRRYRDGEQEYWEVTHRSRPNAESPELLVQYLDQLISQPKAFQMPMNPDE